MKLSRRFWFLLISGSILLGSCADSDEITKIPRIGFEKLEPLLSKNNDTVYIINFWATWCKPCVAELPDFERIHKDYARKPVQVILVSLDFPNKHEQVLLPFVKENNLRSRVIHLTDVDANRWIDKVNPTWSGAIPATLVYKGSERDFFEGSLNYEQIKMKIDPKL